MNHHYFQLIHTLISLVYFATCYELPKKYFINCGSNSSVNLFGQNYTADVVNYANSFSFSAANTSSIRINSSSIHLLYQTARSHTQPFSYNFRTDHNATYLILRLHFFPLFTSYPAHNLSEAKFDVSIFGTLLLSNFSPPNASTPTIHEFLIPIHSLRSNTLQIDFKPSSTFAFINAIEAFFAPDNLISNNNNPPRLVTKQQAKNANTANYFRGLHLKMLHNIHRINMGGGILTPENDTLNRYWNKDDDYLYIPEAAKNSAIRSQKPNWNLNLSDRYIAPDLVYQTAKELNVIETRLANTFNLTWKLAVAKNAKHLVRAHFCNIISDFTGDILFNFYIDGYYGIEVVPREVTYHLAVPFYIDFVVDSDESGVMNISIGPAKESMRKTAFLNGLEIMELMDDHWFGDGSGCISKKMKLFLIVGGVALSFIFILGLFFGVYRRNVVEKSARSWPKNDGSAYIGLVQAFASPSPMSNFRFGLKIPIVEIISATNNFDASLVIGEGGFGKVYKGCLQDGTKVAVKRSQPGHGQGLPEFQTEIIILSKIRHVHLVSLIGYCDEMSEMILVYEFMEKGTLREHLYGDFEKDSKANLSWEKRLEICIGSARGLHYLHSGVVDGIIHRDVKSTNILLDGNYLAKVADFGLSTVLDKSHVTTGIKGSFGYLDPEYFRTLQLNEKSDVYSFGVVLLEVICARPAIKNSLRREEINLAEWGMLWHEKGQLQEIIDPFLVGNINPNSLRVSGETAAKCLQGEGVNRPTMGDVIWDLEYSLQLQNTEGARGEVHEYSTADGSSLGMHMMMVQRLPSNGMNVNKDMSMTFNDSEETSASDIFSQLRIEVAR